MAKSSTSLSADKPAKPEGFPRCPHGNGQSAHKITGKLYDFGPWCDPDGTLGKYETDEDDLHAGRLPSSRVWEGVQRARGLRDRSYGNAS
jgi:hypothetical protein